LLVYTNEFISIVKETNPAYVDHVQINSGDQPGLSKEVLKVYCSRKQRDPLIVRRLNKLRHSVLRLR